ncbi:MAG TPA: NusA-like transcription termination signal-binding factor, partial [Candidatus Norongarragalinales archaeon]|nr:NusA-like transcription termination signal-binding factor [Candidatus Norongarragalinales archaeon]
EDIQLLNLLETRTGAHALDVVRSGDGLIFVVESGQMGKALGKNGQNLIRLRNDVGKPVDLVESADSLEIFVRNLFRPAEVVSVNVAQEGGKKVSVKVSNDSKGLAIGRSGEKIKRARLLLKKYFDVEDVKIV